MHMAHQRQVLTLLWDAGGTFKLKRCAILAEKNNHLKHIVRLGRLELFLAASAAVRDLEDPVTQTELRSFTGSLQRVLPIRLEPLNSGSGSEQQPTKVPAHDTPLLY